MLRWSAAGSRDAAIRSGIHKIGSHLISVIGAAEAASCHDLMELPFASEVFDESGNKTNKATAIYGRAFVSRNVEE